MARKICPLVHPNADFETSACIGEICSWWDPFEKQCAIVSIGVGAMEEIRRRER